MPLSFTDKANISYYIQRVQTLIDSHILEDIRHPFSQSAYIETLVFLNDLLLICDEEGARISFADDVVVTTVIADVSDLIRIARNIACHITNNHQFAGDRADRNAIRFNYSQGVVRFLKTPTYELGCPYPDETALYMGDKVVFLKRHLIRACNEAKVALTPMLQ